MHCIKMLLEVLRCCSGTLVWKWLRVKHVAVIVVATTTRSTTQKSNKEPSLWSLNTFIVTAAAIHLSILLSSKSEVELRDWLPLWPEIRAPCNLILFQFQMEFWGGVQELTKNSRWIISFWVPQNNFTSVQPSAHFWYMAVACGQNRAEGILSIFIQHLFSSTTSFSPVPFWRRSCQTCWLTACKWTWTMLKICIKLGVNCNGN